MTETTKGLLPVTENRAAGLGPEATAAAFPLGGIGTGNVSVGARGELRDWELMNRPGKSRSLPFTFFTIRAAAGQQEPVTRVLESRLVEPHEFNQTVAVGAQSVRVSLLHGTVDIDTMTVQGVQGVPVPLPDGGSLRLEAGHSAHLQHSSTTRSQ